MKLIGYAAYAGTKNVEKEFEGKFNMTGDGQSSVSLHFIPTQLVESNAMYFCAAYITQ